MVLPCAGQLGWLPGRARVQRSMRQGWARASCLPTAAARPFLSPRPSLQLALNQGKQVLAVSAVSALHLMDVANPAAPGEQPA